MPFTYRRVVKVFVASVLLCGLVHILGHSQVAGYMLLTTGCVGMAVTVGSAMGYIDVIGRDGRTISPITIVSYADDQSNMAHGFWVSSVGMLTVADEFP
jgi:hypothetical protein